MFGGADNRMLDQIFNLKFTSKQLVRASKKCEQEEKEEKNKARGTHERGRGAWAQRGHDQPGWGADPSCVSSTRPGEACH